jgi:predicted kinase
VSTVEGDKSYKYTKRILKRIGMSKSFQEFRADTLTEGVYDPGIFKAFFLAGGPGSGKSFVVKQTGAVAGGLKLVNSDDAFEAGLKKAGLSFKMPDSEAEPRDKVRARAKAITKQREKNYIEGRLGMVIDGTGKDYDKIAKQVAMLRGLGYDCYMIFVDTTLDVAKERNLKRERSVPEEIVVDSWNEVQANKGKFQSLFGRRRFMIVDNSEYNEDVLKKSYKHVTNHIRDKVKNPTARQWIEAELAAKRRS